MSSHQDFSWVRWGGVSTLPTAERRRRGTVMRHSPTSGDDAFYAYLRDRDGNYDTYPLVSSGAAARVGRHEYPLDLDGSTDNRTNLLAAVDKADDLGGDTVYLPAGDIAFTGDIEIPSGVDVWGRGGSTLGGGTTLLALNSSSRLSFGEQEVGSYGGLSGNFLLDGQNLSACMLYLGRTLERTFQNIGVIDCDGGGAAVTIEEAQNNQFFSLVVNNNRGDGISFDRGAAGNRFYGVESSTNGIEGGYHVRFTATDATVTNLVAYPLNNHFFGGIFERDGGLLDGVIYHGAGADNSFERVNLSGVGSSREFPLLRMEVGNSGITTQSTRLTFDNCLFTGAVTETTMFDLDDGSVVRVLGWPLIQAFLNQYHLRDTLSRVYVIGNPVLSNVTNTVSATSTGTISQEQVLLDKLTVTNASALHQTTVNGDDASIFVVETSAGSDRFNVSTTGNTISAVNGADMQGFSDNYATQTWSIDGATGDIQTDGALNHDGTTVGFYGATPVTQPTALTAADEGTVDGTYGAEEQAVIENLRTRVGELESKLQDLGLLA